MTAAAGDAALPLDRGSSTASNWNQRFEENLNNQYLRSAADIQLHPLASEVGGQIGDVLNPMLGLFSFAPPGIRNRIIGLALGHALNGQAYALRMHDQGSAQLKDILGNVFSGVTGAIIGGD